MEDWTTIVCKIEISNELEFKPDFTTKPVYWKSLVICITALIPPYIRWDDSENVLCHVITCDYFKIITTCKLRFNFVGKPYIHLRRMVTGREQFDQSQWFCRWRKVRCFGAICDEWNKKDHNMQSSSKLPLSWVQHESLPYSTWEWHTSWVYEEGVGNVDKCVAWDLSKIHDPEQVPSLIDDLYSTHICTQAWTCLAACC